MEQYRSPGVYVEEVPTGPRPIEGAGTATAAFVGFAPAGEANRPILVTSWSQFTEQFGALVDGGRRKDPFAGKEYMPRAVYGYFNNGGRRCYVVRITAPGQPVVRPAGLDLPTRSSSEQAAIRVEAKEGSTAEVVVTVEAVPTSGETDDGRFTVRVQRGAEEEAFPDLTLGRRGRNAVEIINRESRIIAAVELSGVTGTVADRAPADGRYMIPTAGAITVPRVDVAQITGSAADRTGLEGLQVAEDVTMLCCPDLMGAYQAGTIQIGDVQAVQRAMIDHCERMRDRVAILDTPPGLSPQQVLDWRNSLGNFDTSYAALYYPWIKVPEAEREMPPSGHVAGVYARSDVERGVHKAPANEVLRGVLEPAIQITQNEQGALNPKGINCIRSFVGRGIRVWGARTLSDDAAWRYVNVRRLFIYIEKSIERGTQWVVFEPNNTDLWARVKRDIDAFLTTAWRRDGMLFGRTAAEAFYVKCDEELNPPEARDLGQLVVEVGLAPVKPAEFVIFRIGQWVGGGA